MSSIKVRIDKWLWSVRIFKSRSLATDTVKAGKVKKDGKTIKPSYIVSQGDLLEVRKNGFNLLIKVEICIEKRVSAVLAAPCFTDLTPESEINKYKEWFSGTAVPERRDKGEGRPTKKERRDIDEFKDWYIELEDDND